MPVRLTALKKILCFLFSYLALDKGKDSTKEGCVVRQSRQNCRRSRLKRLRSPGPYTKLRSV